MDSDKHLRKPEVHMAAWQSWMGSAMLDARPNAGHGAIASWQAPDRRVSVVTQNIDGLHQQSGSRDVLALRGTYWSTRCLSCADRRPTEEALDQIRAGETDPHCRLCLGILRIATVGFGEVQDPEAIATAKTAAGTAYLAVGVGTSLQVQPAASLCSVAVEAGVPLATINSDPTPHDALATVVIRAEIPATLSRVQVR